MLIGFIWPSIATRAFFEHTSLKGRTLMISIIRKNAVFWDVTACAEVRQFLQEPHGVTFQKTVFFIATAVKTSNLT
jgi:hypothetical protein